MERVRRSRIDNIGGKEKDEEDERIDPSMSKGEISPPAKKATDFSAFRASGWFGFWILEVADWSARGSVQWMR